MKIDELLPSYDVRARYQILVHAPLEATVEAFESVDFSALPLTRFLMGLRTLMTRKRSERGSGTQLERLQRAGFIELARLPRQEIVLGVVGRFWRIDSGIITGLTAEQILHFQREGYAKAAWNFAFSSELDHVTKVSTETRIHCIGRVAKYKFRAYWLLVGPFSGIIRKEMLRMIKRKAEQTPPAVMA